MMLFQKISIHTPQKGFIHWNFLGVGGEGSVRPKKIKKCMKLNWNFQRGGRVLEKNPFHGRGIFLELQIQNFYNLDF